MESTEARQFFVLVFHFGGLNRVKNGRGKRVFRTVWDPRKREDRSDRAPFTRRPVKYTTRARQITAVYHTSYNNFTDSVPPKGFRRNGRMGKMGGSPKNTISICPARQYFFFSIFTEIICRENKKKTRKIRSKRSMGTTVSYNTIFPFASFPYRPIFFFPKRPPLVRLGR